MYGEKAGGKMNLLTSEPSFWDWEGLKNNFLSWDTEVNSAIIRCFLLKINSYIVETKAGHHLG